MATKDESTRSRILDAAGIVFADHGFEKATIREICKQAEVNLAAVNYHFGDKSGLYKETIRHAHRLAADQVPLPQWASGTSPQEKLRDFVRMMIHRMLVVHGFPWQARLMMREVTQPTGVCQELTEEYIRPHFQILLKIIDELVPTDTSQHRKHKLGFSIVGQCMFYHLNEPVIRLLVPEDELANHFEPALLAEHIADVMLAACDQRTMFQSSKASASDAGAVAQSEITP